MDWDSIRGSEPVAAAWRLVRRELAMDLPGQLVGVPHLPEAAFYDLMVCFTKCPAGVLDKLAGVGPFYRLHGHVADLVDGERTDMQGLLEMCSRPAREDLSMADYSRTWSRGERAITVQLAGLTKLVITWTLTEGGLVLNTAVEELEEVKKVYVISEVVYADVATVTVETEERRVERTEQQVPVAFSYFKFPVAGDGVVQAARGRGRLDREAEFLLVGGVGGGGRGWGG